MIRAYALAIPLLAFGLIIGCSSDPPSVRVWNDNPKKANVQFKPSAGNTININDVDPGTATNYQEFPEGRFDVAASLSGSSDAPTTVMTTEEDYNYTVVVLNTTPASLRVDSEKK